MMKILDSAEKKFRVYDMMTSMFFKLADYYHHVDLVYDVFELALSTLICGVTFLGETSVITISHKIYTLTIGFSSIGLFAFTLIKQRLDYKKLAEEYKFAGKKYAAAKSKLKKQLDIWTDEGFNNTDINLFMENLDDTLKDLATIPENKFHKLKHYHQQKVEYSKFLDSNKSEPWYLCKFKFYYENIFKNKGH